MLPIWGRHRSFSLAYSFLLSPFFLPIFQYAVKDSTAETVLLFVLLTARRVDTRTDCVLVKQDGWVQIVLQVINNTQYDEPQCVCLSVPLYLPACRWFLLYVNILCPRNGLSWFIFRVCLVVWRGLPVSMWWILHRPEMWQIQRKLFVWKLYTRYCILC